MKKIITLYLIVLLLLAAGSTASAAILWGCTNGSGDAGWWTGGQIFTVDTGTGTVSVKQSYSSSTLLAFGDIAVRPNGEVYVTYYGNEGFDKIAKVNTSTWGFDWVQDLGTWTDQVNALEFIDGTLYGVTGGGQPANLMKFTLTGSGVTAVNLGSLGINSDGDIAKGPDGKIYYTSWETGGTSELNIVTLSPVGKTGKEIVTSNGWAGLAGVEGSLFTGTYNDQKLYTLNYSTSDPTYIATMVYDLSSSLGGTITGLSIPEPASAMILLVCAAWMGTKRRR